MNNDPVAMSHQAINRTYTRMREMIGKVEDDLATRPAVPLTDEPGKAVATSPLPKRERLLDYAMKRQDSAALGALFSEARAREKLPDNKPVSRRLFEQLVLEVADVLDLGDFQARPDLLGRA